MWLYRNRASEFELIVEAECLPEARLRYRIIARHYTELADREEHADKARMAQTREQLRAKRREAAQWEARLPYRQYAYCTQASLAAAAKLWTVFNSPSETAPLP